MTSAIGWYGPLIDLSRAASHVGDFVQLLVFVHRSTPVQFKLSKGGEAIRTDIHVGDDTRPFFSVSLWQKQMGLTAIPGDVILLQNVKIIKFGDVVEAKTVLYSSLQSLIHPYESLISKGVVDLMIKCQVGERTKEKLLKVIEWVQRSKSAFCTKLPSSQKRQLSRNWNVPEERKSCNCFSLSEVRRLTNSCKATFYASVGEIFLPITWRTLGEFEKEKMFISRRLSESLDKYLVEDLICTGCQLCGSPLDLGCGPTMERNSVPLHCDRSSNRLHAVNFIYRPFMLYVWDELESVPLLVRNNGAELLFGNIKAERVYQCYKERQQEENHYSDARATNIPKVATETVLSSCSLDDDKNSQEGKEKQQCDKKINSYLIWLIILKMLLKQGKNSPLKFEVIINGNLDKESGKFEMVGVSVPCFVTKNPQLKR